MIQHSKQNWEVGQTVKVGFLTLIVQAAITTPGDGLPDAYFLTTLAGMPRSQEVYEAHKRLAAEHATYTHCTECRAPFTDANVHTEAGWQETQLSGLCEDCFDRLTRDPKEDE